MKSSITARNLTPPYSSASTIHMINRGTRHEEASTAEATILAHNRGSSDLEIITPPLNGVINAKLVYRTTWPPLHSLGYKNSSSSLRHLSPGRWDLPARSRRVDRFLDAPRIRLAASVAPPHDRFRVTAGRMVVSPGCVGVFQPGERAWMNREKEEQKRIRWTALNTNERCFPHYPNAKDPSELMWLKSVWSAYTGSRLISTTLTNTNTFILFIFFCFGLIRTLWYVESTLDILLFYYVF